MGGVYMLYTNDGKGLDAHFPIAVSTDITFLTDMANKLIDGKPEFRKCYEILGYTDLAKCGTEVGSIIISRAETLGSHCQIIPTENWYVDDTGTWVRG